MIEWVECYEERPIDRDYNKHGKPRNPQIEICGDGISYALRTVHVYGLIIWEKDEQIRKENT